MMYARTELLCAACGRREWVPTDELEYQGRGCCGESMEPTGSEEYDEEYAREMNERNRDRY